MTHRGFLKRESRLSEIPALVFWCTSELRSGMADNESEFIDQSTSVPPEPTSMSPMDGCLDWTLCDGESSFDIGEFVGQDFDYFGLL